jgi:hypothetical protein
MQNLFKYTFKFNIHSKNHYNFYKLLRYRYMIYHLLSLDDYFFFFFNIITFITVDFYTFVSYISVP